MRHLAYGIDFGTTNSAISVLDACGQATVLPLDNANSLIMKSVIFFPQGKARYYIGQEAIKQYIQSGMKGRLIQSVKSALSDDKFHGTQVNGKMKSLEDLTAHIIASLKNRADKVIGRKIDRVVLGRPAIFSNDPLKEELARERLSRAANLAGFREIRFQLEPIAAALHFESTLNKAETVLVADLGGGTSDFTVMRLSPDRTGSANRNCDVLASSGVYTGGDNLDAEIMMHDIIQYFGSLSRFQSGEKLLPMPQYLIRSLCDWRKLSFIKDSRQEREALKIILRSAQDDISLSRLKSLIENNLSYVLAQSVESVKCRLSIAQEALLDFHHKGIDLSVLISREGFNMSISREINAINRGLQEAVDTANIPISDIDTVFLTGGTSRVPAISQIFFSRFHRDKVKQGDTFLSVAKGLALSSTQLF